MHLKSSKRAKAARRGLRGSKQSRRRFGTTSNFCEMSVCKSPNFGSLNSKFPPKATRHIIPHNMPCLYHMHFIMGAENGVRVFLFFPTYYSYCGSWSIRYGQGAVKVYGKVYQAWWTLDVMLLLRCAG